MSDQTAAGAAPKPNALLDITAGTVGGLLQVASGHPLDTAKVRLQTQVTAPGQAPQYAGAIDALKKIWAAEGLGGLYKVRAAAARVRGVSPCCFEIHRDPSASVSSQSRASPRRPWAYRQ